MGKDVFKHNSKLEYLSLEGNFIRTVEAGAFDNLAVLKSLMFRDNPCYSNYAFYNRGDVTMIINRIEISCSGMEKITDAVDVRTIYHL